MNLKRLEIIGFKSFADKTIIEFNEGITGIVGPNGSGKSNFADAIRWVLGEQAPSTLRGKKMTELIFVGTKEGRSSHSYCEVSLIFDNTNKKVFKALEFDEVKITRKLFKSGESVYYINGNDCLLKNIKELMRDTGLGREGYSIIGQGKVEEIVNAKAENRRVIFEEAAGISNYKNRKNDAERNLNNTRADIERIEDIIKEVGRRLPNLEKQSNDAKKFAQLYEDLKINEINHYLFSAKNNKNVIDNINTKLNGVKEEIAYLNDKISDCETEYAKLNADLAKSDNDLTSVREARTNLLLENQKKVGETNTLTERLNALKQELERTSSVLNKNYETVSTNERELSNNNHYNELYQEELAKLNTNYNNSKVEYDEITGFLIEREEEIENSHRAYLDAVTQLADVKVNTNKLINDCKYLKDKQNDTASNINKLENTLEEKNGQFNEIKSQLQSFQSQRDSVYKEIVNTRNQVNNLKFEQNTLNPNIRTLTNSVASFEAKKKVMEGVKNQYENFLNPVKRLMQECSQDRLLASKIIGVVAELIKVPQKYEIAMEVALGGRLQNVVTSTVDDVKYAIDVLKRKRLGSITFLPLTSMRSRFLSGEQRNVLNEPGCLGVANELITFDKAYTNLFSNLLGATIICDTFDNASAIMKKYNRSFWIVTLEGESFATQGSITGGSNRHDVNGILSQEREMEETFKLYEQSKKDLAKASARIIEVDKEYGEAYSKLQNLEDELRKKDIIYDAITEKSNDIVDSIDSEQAVLQKFKEENEYYLTKIADIEKILASKDTLELDIATTTTDIDENSIKVKLELEEANRKKTECSERITALKIEINKLENMISNCHSDSERLTKENELKNIEIAEEIKIKATLTENIAKTEATLNNVELSDKDKEKLSQIEQVIGELESLKQTISNNIIKVNTEKDEAVKRNTEARETLIKDENSIDKIMAQLSLLENRILEEYQIEPEQCESYETEGFNDVGATTHINNLKRDINKLGVINTEAILEFEEENARYTAISTERDDLVRAEKDLLNLIKSISTEMLSIFNFEFERIAKNFEITFKELFGGGKGCLRLDNNCDDPLNAGVEIEVALPGKMQNSIASLSGGEKAIVAIAILFAILKSKPMPFCVLDEIEAALDDSNVRLFAKYLKRFANDTQFIVISHRQPTMEQTNRLYGVTMEERGVSKVVSVELSDAINNSIKGVK